jgi:hypothetical protein
MTHSLNALKARLNWSKNVSNERNAPWQIVLGSMDTAFCVLASLSLWMELELEGKPQCAAFSIVLCDDNSIPAGGKSQKRLHQQHGLFNKIIPDG